MRRLPAWRWDFAARVAVAGSLLIVAACASLGWILMRREVSQEERNLAERGQTIARELARENVLSLLSGDVETLRRRCRAAFVHADVAACRFVDSGGNTLAAVGQPPRMIGSPEAAEAAGGAVDAWEFEAPVVFVGRRQQREEIGLLGAPGAPERRIIGHVTVVLALRRLNELRAEILFTTTALTALVTLVAVIVTGVLARALTRPLKELSAAADAIARGELGTTVAVRTDDEVGALALSFNAMAESLARSHAALEESNRDLEAKVATRTERLEAMNRELEEANRLKSEFLATVSHELRTPLNVIIGYASMLSDDALGTLTPGQRELLDQISRYSRQQLDLITSVLDFSRLASGRVALRLERLEVGPMLAEIASLHAAALAARNVRIVVDVPPDVPALETDRVKLHEVIRNLADNAVKFTSQGTITLRVRRADGDRVALEVADTGVGIAPADLECIWQEFRQVGEARGNGGGVGLGLSIVRQLVAVLGGTVSVTSQPGVGSTFRVELPLRPAAGAEAPRVSDRSPELA